MPLPLAFWHVSTPQQLVFYHPLPEGTETRAVETDRVVWVIPRMTLHTRFPMMQGKHPLVARDLIWKVYREDERKHLLVSWCWNDDGDIQMTFFRNTSNEVLSLGETTMPPWFAELEEIAKEAMPTAWDRIMEDEL